jgi:hypothetical protein
MRYLFCLCAEERITVVAVPRTIEILDVLPRRCFTLWTAISAVSRNGSGTVRSPQMAAVKPPVMVALRLSCIVHLREIVARD